MPRFETLTTDELLTYMQRVEWYAPLKRWQARANGAHPFGQGYTPREAILDALTLCVGPPEKFVAQIPRPLDEEPDYDNDPMFN